MGIYYNDPSGLGSWWVPDGQTPAQAIDKIKADTGINLDPRLQYSISYNAEAHTPAPPAPPAQKDAIAKGAIHPRPLITNVTSTGTTGAQHECPDGWFFDEFNQVCVSIDYPVGPGGPTGGQNQGPGGVNVTVNNAVNLSKGVGQAIADAVAGGISEAVDKAKDSAAIAADAVENGIKRTIDAVSSAASGLIQGIHDALGYIAGLIQQHIGDLINFITNHIGDVLNTIKDVYVKYIAPAIQQISDVLKKVNDVIANTIAPIFNTISQVYQQTNALITAIKEDVHNGISGILQLPNDISNAITSIEGALGRVLDQIGLKKKEGTSVFLDPTGKDSIYDRLAHIGKGLGILGQIDGQKITFNDFKKLSEPDISRAASASIAALGTELTAFIGDFVAGGSRTIDALKTSITTLPLLLGVEMGTWIGTWELIRATDQLFEPFYKFAKEDIAAKAGLGKLSAGDALAAWKRSFISDDDLYEDLAVNGWDKDRVRILKDLQQHLFDVATAVDMYHRKIIDYSQLTSTALEHKINPEQLRAIVEQSAKLFDVQLALQANRWGLIDDAALDAVLTVHRYTPEEITATKATLYELESPQDVLIRDRIVALYTGLGFSPPGFSNVPPDLASAVKRSGQNPEVAKDVWQASFYVHPLDRWVELYFRGVRDRRELDAAMDYYRVPAQFRDDILREHHALIPFRTIPTMMANGIISETYAKQQLQAHGFDLPAIEALIKYAQVAHHSAKVTASGDVFGLSVQTARGYYDAGTITPEQYTEVLLAHGLSKDSAALVVKVETQHAAMVARRQLAADVIAEANAGLITIDQAVNQMDTHQFSAAEKSKAINAIHKQKRQNVKMPSEPELHSFVKAKAISIDNYREGMKQLGWSDTWITAFTIWRFPDATQTASPA